MSSLTKNTKINLWSFMALRELVDIYTDVDNDVTWKRFPTYLAVDDE
jgi:hypothetical protein